MRGGEDWVSADRPEAWLLTDTPGFAPAGQCSAASIRAGAAFVRNPLALIGLVIVYLLLCAAIFAPWLDRRTPPSSRTWRRLAAAARARIGFGTDELGRDTLEPRLFGSRVTLTIVALVDHRGADRPR